MGYDVSGLEPPWMPLTDPAAGTGLWTARGGTVPECPACHSALGLRATVLDDGRTRAGCQCGWTGSGTELGGPMDTTQAKTAAPVQALGTASPRTPDHYRGHRGLQPFDIIDAFALGFYTGNVIKYVCRARSKGGLDDLKKARHYLDEAITRAESGVPADSL